MEGIEIQLKVAQVKKREIIELSPVVDCRRRWNQVGHLRISPWLPSYFLYRLYVVVRMHTISFRPP